MSKARLVLASKSPRRSELLTLLGFGFTVVPSRAKKFRVKERLRRISSVEPRATRDWKWPNVCLVRWFYRRTPIVVIDDEILGKPIDESDAIRMLEQLRGRRHSVYTAVVVLDSDSGASREGLEHTKVWFSDLAGETIKDYVRREDVMDKAGAYAIQGFAGAFIPKIEGNYHNVVGLPLPLTYRLLCQTLL